MFAPDVMHEFELGTWKNSFIHMLRVHAYYDGENLTTLNLR